MSTENINNNGIKWGPFRLRIPFIHIKLLPSEFIQGFIISGATALAGAPIVEALGLDFMQAVAVCFIASFLITSSPIIFGEPMAAGWVTPALPLVMIVFGSKGLASGEYGDGESFKYMAAMCIEFTLLILFLGLTGLGKIIIDKIPNALKSGIILGAAIAAFDTIFIKTVPYDYIGSSPTATFSILIICIITTFSEPFKRLGEKNKFIKLIGSLGLLPGFLIAALVGYFTGEIVWVWENDIFIVPPVVEVYKLTSPFSIGFPSLAQFIEVIPLVLIGYLLLFGDFVTGTEIIKEAQKNRPDEQIEIDINRSHNSVGMRNLLGTIINPFFPTQGALWTGVHVIVVQRWQQGKDIMRSIYDGIGSYYLMGLPFLFFFGPFIDLMKPLLLLALSVTLILTGIACSYVAMSIVKKNSEIAISIITAFFVAFGSFNGIAAPWIGIVVGLILSILLIDNKKHE